MALRASSMPLGIVYPLTVSFFICSIRDSLMTVGSSYPFALVGSPIVTRIR